MKIPGHAIQIFFLAAFLVLDGCWSSTVIQSVPEGAKLYLDSEPVGVTPYEYRDNKFTATMTTVRLEMNGYEPLYTSFSRDEQVMPGPAVAGFFVLIPWLWVMGYNPIHTYELTPLSSAATPATDRNVPATQPGTQSKADRLREMKKLLDEGVLTQQEYDREKEKILREDE